MTSLRTSPWIFAAQSATLSMGYGVLFTVVGDFRDEYGISETAIGVVIGIGFLSAFVAQVFIAPFADRGLARRLVVVGAVANMVGLFFMGFGESLGLILFGRIISGIGIGTAVPAVRRIVILSDPGNLGRNLGRLLSAGVGGFALGPAVSAVLVGPAGLAAPFVVVAVLNALFLIPVASFRLQEGETSSRHGLALDLLRHKLLVGALVLGAASFMMIGTFDALWDVVHEDLDTPTWMANLGITFFALPLVVFGPVAGRWAQTYGPFRIAAAGLTIAAGFMFTYGQVPSGEWIFAVSLVHSITDGFTFAAPGVAIAMVVDEDRQAAAQGLMGAAQSIVAGVTAIVMGGLYDSSGRATAYTVSAIAMAVFIAVGMGLAASFWTANRHKAAATV